ncbi:peptidoglycan-binding domain-containing protein [Roseitranquillus sediminis]|uniref:peptidoglycan-binding domain-containing protein n=1 Tax=Roseitranquillus sediminis TaxID=2809051 RepID=UPI001D0C4F8B|nr:peptidoglycan-binding domain-containing protein [Roseitranquillus sediminis]MBM9595391.1 peptidoglycan-binding protein [Roseitranquillus sediminis]
MLPSISQLKYRDLEVSFKKIEKEIHEVKKKVYGIEESFFRGADLWTEQEKLLSEWERADRQRENDANAKELWELPEAERLSRQETATRNVLFQLGLPITSVKNALQRAGAYDGPLDVSFTADFADSVAAFQKQNGISPVDGIYGHDTHRFLASKLREQQE